MRVVLKARTTSPGHFFRSSNQRKRNAKNFVRIDKASIFGDGANAVGIAVGGQPGMAFLANTVCCNISIWGSIGSGLIPGNNGFNSWRMATYWTPQLAENSRSALRARSRTSNPPQI